jgi:hypothetical protein
LVETGIEACHGFVCRNSQAIRTRTWRLNNPPDNKDNQRMIEWGPNEQSSMRQILTQEFVEIQ